MRVRRRWPEFAAVLLLLAAAGAVTAAPAAETPPARQAELRHLLLHDCGSCHGMTLRGGLGRPLLPEALADRSDEVLAEIILQGIRGTAMPPWRGELSPEDVAWIVRELRRGDPHP
jgi:cytochrome c55X